VERGDWGQGKNCTLFMFDNVASGALTVKDSTPSKLGTYNSAWNLEQLPIPI